MIKALKTWGKAFLVASTLLAGSGHAATPTLSITRNPNPMVAGQNYTLSWSSTNAISVSYSCTASGTGFVGSGRLSANGSSTGVASAGWVGYPSSCVWTARRADGSVTVNEIRTTVAAATPPTLTVTRNPTPMVAGQNYTLNWSSTNATSVAYNCTASGTGFVGNATLAANGSSTGVASAGWVGNPSACVWTASGPAGSVTVNETMTTEAAVPPTLSVTRNPNPMVWGQNYTLSWSSTNATSVAYSCTANGTGFVGNATLAANGSSTGVASAGWG